MFSHVLYTRASGPSRAPQVPCLTRNQVRAGPCSWRPAPFVPLLKCLSQPSLILPGFLYSALVTKSQIPDLLAVSTGARVSGEQPGWSVFSPCPVHPAMGLAASAPLQCPGRVCRTRVCQLGSGVPSPWWAPLGEGLRSVQTQESESLVTRVCHSASSKIYLCPLRCP